MTRRKTTSAITKISVRPIVKSIGYPAPSG